MSQRLGPISRRDLIKALRRHGWTGPWQDTAPQVFANAVRLGRCTRSSAYGEMR